MGTSYDQIAHDYYNNTHTTCRNFDAATKAALENHRFKFPGPTLEVGAGNGCVRKYLNHMADVQQDASIEMLKLLPREYSFYRVCCDARHLPFIDGSFGSIIGFLIDPFLDIDFLKEAARLLYSGGQLLFTTPSYEWGTNLRGGEIHETHFTIDSGPDEGTDVKCPSNLYRRESLVDMMDDYFEAVAIANCYLPSGTEPAGTVKLAAEKLKIDPSNLPLVYLVSGRRP